MKYIIKNCPNCYNYGEHDYWCEFAHYTNPCKKSDCLLKRIVKECQMNMDDDDFRYILKNINEEGVDVWQTDSNRALIHILRLLEIEECE